MQTPDVTPIQVGALAAAALDLAASFGLHLSSAQHDSLLALIGLLATVVAADAHIRHGRSTGNPK